MRLATGFLLAAAASAQNTAPFKMYFPIPEVVFGKNVQAIEPMNIEHEVAKADREQGLTKMVIFGKINEVNKDFFSVAQSEWSEDGIMWTASWTVDNAYSLAVHFDKFDVPEGGALFLMGVDKKVIGAFTHETQWHERNLMVDHTAGNTVTVQYFQHKDTKGKATIHVDSVTSAFRDPENMQNAGVCNIQAACSNDRSACANCAPTNRACSVQCTWIGQNVNNGQWAGPDWFANEQRAAVALVSAAGSRFCSGSFINNVNRDPLVLTAAHCGAGGTTLVRQFWRDPSCQSTSNSGGTDFQTRGNTRIVVNRPESDATLMFIGDAQVAANTFLSGWDSLNTPASIANMVGVHHPAASNQKVSHAGVPTLTRWSGTGESTHWRVPVWTEATTEGGSSGSPLYHRQTKRIIGQLHGGSAACPALNGWDSYGGIFRTFLDANFVNALTSGTGVRFLDGRFLRAADEVQFNNTN